jgi:FkbM family methyltransferase
MIYSGGMAHSAKRARSRRLVVSLGVLVLVPILLLLGYVLLRDPEWRSIDYVRFSRSWEYYGRRIGALPKDIEPTLVRAGILRYSPVPIDLPWGGKMKLDPSDFVARILIGSGRWEEPEWDWIAAGLKEGDVFVDVGAHHGAFSLRASQAVGPAGQVIAVEPDPGTLARLRENIELNRYANIRVEPVAFGDQAGTMTLYVVSGQAVSLSEKTALSLARGGQMQRVEVPIIPMDQALGDLNGARISVIKVDVEGAETIVLRGAANTIKTHRPAVVVETIPAQLENMGSSLDELSTLLRSYGYQQVAATAGNALWKFKE